MITTRFIMDDRTEAELILFDINSALMMMSTLPKNIIKDNNSDIVEVIERLNKLLEDSYE